MDLSCDVLLWMVLSEIFSNFWMTLFGILSVNNANKYLSPSDIRDCLICFLKNNNKYSIELCMSVLTLFMVQISILLFNNIWYMY